MRIVKNIFRWIAVVFFVCGGSVCATMYGSVWAALLWYWTAIFVSPLPEVARDKLSLSIDDRVITCVRWVFIAASIATIFVLD